MRLILAWIMVFLLTGALAAVNEPAAEPKTETQPPAVKTVTIEASDKPVRDVLNEIVKATGETILVENLVEGNVTARVKDADIEQALDAVSMALGIEWRKIYVVPGSIYAKDADALASQMRTVLSLKFPDIVISSVGTGGSFMHVQNQSAAGELIKSITPKAGLAAVYLVTDDEKAYKKELKDESRKKVENYIEANKKLMEAFLKMSPEERLAVLRESMNMMSQADPEMIKEMMSSVFELDPEYITNMNRIGMQALFESSPEARRNLLRMSIRQQADIMKSLTPEQMQQLQEDIQAIQAEMQNEGQ